MFVRLAIEEDEDDFVRMSIANLHETMPGEPYDEYFLRASFHSYLDKASPTIWIVEHQRKPVAFMAAYMRSYDYRDGLYVTQRVIYVSPENRGTRAAVLLVKELIRWAKSIGANEIVGGNDNSFRSERTAGFLEHFGFKRVGLALTKQLTDV